MRSKKQPTAQIAPRLAKLAVPVTTLSLDPANLRLHGDTSIAAIAASLKRFGQQKPIVVDSSGVIIAGNGTLQAALRLGWTHVAAARSDLSGLDRTLYAIADNRTAELSAWDTEALRLVAGSIDPADLDVTGWTAKDLEDLLSSSPAGEVAQDEIPEPEKTAVSRVGDLWLLGTHRLLCGDSTSPADVARVMNGERAVLFATDPPYLVGYDGTNHPQSFSGGGNKDWSDTYGKTWDDADGNTDLYDKFIRTAVDVAITQDAAWYCWHASRRQAMLEAAWTKAGAFVHCQIIWAKNRPVLTRTWYMWQHEPCLMGWITGKKPAKAEGAESASTVWNFDVIPNGDERPDHPTPKPVELFAIPMRQHTSRGEICYEPFAGSGTQIIAAEQLGRRCFALELSPVYADVIVRRWQKLTGQVARLDGDGRSWDEVRQERAACPSAPVERASSQAARDPAPADQEADSSASSTPRRKSRAGTPAKARRTRVGTAPSGAS